MCIQVPPKICLETDFQCSNIRERPIVIFRLTKMATHQLSAEDSCLSKCTWKIKVLKLNISQVVWLNSLWNYKAFLHKNNSNKYENISIVRIQQMDCPDTNPTEHKSNILGNYFHLFIYFIFALFFPLYFFYLT